MKSFEDKRPYLQEIEARELPTKTMYEMKNLIEDHPLPDIDLFRQVLDIMESAFKTLSDN